jgi:acetylornithine deacetylase/succinyl-diaminopimelate desuccinylase-like protein
LAHLDVVEAKPEDWSVPPFKLTEKDGFFYGRGVYDDKAGATTFVAALLRMKQEGFLPKRDLILALTAGEESDASYSGIEWVVKDHRDLIDAAFCLNADGGDILKRNGKLEARTVQAAEKVVLNFKLRTTNPGGHSSVPVRSNAIYQLATAVLKIADYAFPVDLNPSSRGYFEQTAKLQPTAIAKDMSAVTSQSKGWETAAARLSHNPVWNSMMRTTCVATLIQGGHASNALPQRAEANINCRMVPQGDPKEVQRQLEQVIGDKGVQVIGSEKDMGYRPSTPPPFTDEVMEPIREVTAQRMPGVPIIPIMETGGTDGGTLISNGIPTYGLSAVAVDAEENRAHGRDERIGVQDLYDGLDYTYELLRAYTE